MSIVKKIKSEFNKTQKMVTYIIHNGSKEENKVILNNFIIIQASGKLIEFMKKFNNDLLIINEEDENILLDYENFISQKELVTSKEKDINENQEDYTVWFVIAFDYFYKYLNKRSLISATSL